MSVIVSQTSYYGWLIRTASPVFPTVSSQRSPSLHRTLPDEIQQQERDIGQDNKTTALEIPLEKIGALCRMWQLLSFPGA